MSKLQLPTYISFTGADDKTDINALIALDQKYSQHLEWGLLYFPEKQGQPRNPTNKWIHALQLEAPWLNLTAHLCGHQIFQEMLHNKDFYLFNSDQMDDFEDAPLYAMDRLQLNINARDQFFTREEVLEIYSKLNEKGRSLVLQYHAESAVTIESWLGREFQKFIPEVRRELQDTLAILYDESRGKGVAREGWNWPNLTTNTQFLQRRFAGGVNEDNVIDVIRSINGSLIGNAQWTDARPEYVLDLESGARNIHNEFDLPKVERILDKVYGKDHV